MLTQLSNHRSNIKGWESMKTVIWGRHRWDFFKFADYKEEDPIDTLAPYFTKNNSPIPKSKREEIKNFSKIIEKTRWFPLNRLYLNALYENSITGEKKELDLSKKEHRQIFLNKSKINSSEFFRWVLYVMDWEKLKTIDDILSNFFILHSKFQSFIRSDVNHETFKELFNSSIAELDEHNIESIVNLDEKVFYEFVTHPKVSMCSPKNALRKLFFLISNSEFLKGVGPFQTWGPSLENYTKRLDDIFSGKYSKNHKDSFRFRRLKEHEIRLYDSDECKSYIDSSNFIPEEIKATYGIIGWEANIIKPEKITTREMEKYMSMKRTVSDKIREDAKRIKEEYREKNANRKDLDIFTKQTVDANKKRKKERKKNPEKKSSWKDIYDNKV